MCFDLQIWVTTAVAAWQMVTYAVGRVKCNDSGFGARLKGTSDRLHFDNLLVVFIEKLRAEHFVWKVDQNEEGQTEGEEYEQRALPEKSLQMHALHRCCSSASYVSFFQLVCATRCQEN